MRFARVAAGDEGGGGGSGSGSGSGASTGSGGSPPASPPPVDHKAEARAAVLKDLGFDSEDAYKAHLAEKKRADEARMSEAEKREKAFKDALDERGKAEAKAEKHKSEAEALRAQIALRDKLDTEQVKPGERRVAEVLLEDERAKLGKDFNETKFWTELRKERPYLFAGDQPQQQASANTTTSAPAGASGGASPFGGTQTFDAMTAPKEEVIKRRQSLS